MHSSARNAVRQRTWSVLPCTTILIRLSLLGMPAVLFISAVFQYHFAHMRSRVQEGDTPLQCAARNGHTEAVKALLAAGANKEAMNRVCSRHSPPVLVEGFRCEVAVG